MGRNPFWREIEYDASSKGFWTYDWMVIKLNDWNIIHKYLHPVVDFIIIYFIIPMDMIEEEKTIWI